MSQSVIDRAFERLATAEGDLSTAAATLLQLGHFDLATELGSATAVTRSVSRQLVKREAEDHA